MRTTLLALLLTVGSLTLHGQAPDCQFTQTFTATGYGVTTSNQAVSNVGTQCVTWRLSYYADNMTALSIQVEGAPDSLGAPGTFAAVPTTACSTTVQPPCTLDGTNPLTDPNHATVAFRGYYAWMALHVTTFTPSGGTPNTITARMYGYKGTSPAASYRGGSGGSSFYQSVDNAGTPLTQRPTLNFTGTGVSCADNSGATRTDCTITGGGGSGGTGSTVFSSTTTAGPDNSAAETSVIGTVTGSKTIAANTFANGTVLQVHAQGFFSLPAVSDSLTLKMKCGATVIGSAVLTPGAGVLTNGSWRFWLDIAARGTGAGGAFITNGLLELSGSALTDTTAQVLNTTTVAYDFTTSCAFDVTAQWGAAQVGETLKGTNAAAWFAGGANFVPYTGATADLNMGSHNIIVGGSVTAGSGSGNTGALDLTGKTSGNTVTVTVDDSTAAGTVKLPGVTGTLDYVSTPGAPGNCPEFAADGIGLSDTGNPCGSGGGGGNPYLHPSTPTPIVPANWSDFNMASCTRTNTGNFEQIVSNATSGNNICGRTIAFPAGAFTRTLAVIPLLSGTQYSTVGFGITDGTKIGTCSIQNNAGGVYLNGARCANSGSCSGSYPWTQAYQPAAPSIMFFRLTDDGAGNLSCQWSADGTFFSTMWTDKDTTGAGGYMTPSNLIYFVNSAVSNTVSALTVISYQ